MTRAKFFEELGMLMARHRLEGNKLREEPPAKVLEACEGLASAVEVWVPFQSTEDRAAFKKGLTS